MTPHVTDVTEIKLEQIRFLAWGGYSNVMSEQTFLAGNLY